MNILLSVILETANILFGNWIASDCSYRLLGLWIAIWDYLSDKKKLTSVERTHSSSKHSKTVKFWAKIRGWTYLITVKFEIFWTLKFKKILVSLVNSGRMQFSSRHFVQLDIDQLIHFQSFSSKFFKVQNYENWFDFFEMLRALFLVSFI